jgi:hypothetical protein
MASCLAICEIASGLAKGWRRSHGDDYAALAKEFGPGPDDREPPHTAGRALFSNDAHGEWAQTQCVEVVPVELTDGSVELPQGSGPAVRPPQACNSRRTHAPMAYFLTFIVLAVVHTT